MNPGPKQVVVCGSFDDLRSKQVRFLEEASKLGELTVQLWDDDSVCRQNGAPPKFPEAERCYLVQALRFVSRVTVTNAPADLNTLPDVEGYKPQIWVVGSAPVHPAREKYCAAHGIELRALRNGDLQGFPETPPTPSPPGRKKVIVTGCFDWFHSGHVRFFEEVSTHGDLYVCVGHDANIRLLKGDGHPLHSQDERRYMVGAVRFVKLALVTTGRGWLDAEPEMQRFKPDIYAVNEDGDQGGKREYCEQHGIEYLVLKRTPAPGLPARNSTKLRGF